MDERTRNRWMVVGDGTGGVRFNIRIPVAKKNGGEARVVLSPVNCDREAALNLAAWLVVLADDGARFSELLEQVRELAHG